MDNFGSCEIVIPGRLLNSKIFLTKIGLYFEIVDI